MKKSALAIVLVLGILLSACKGESEETKKKKKKTKKTEKTESVETEDPDDTGMTDPTTQPDASSETTESTTEKTDPSSAGTVPEPTYDFLSDPFSLYADDSFSIISGYAFWYDEDTDITIYLDTENHSFKGEYQQTDYNDDYSETWKYKCEFSGSFDKLKRVNDYSFTTDVLALYKDTFDPYDDEDFSGNPVHVQYADPAGFSDPDELIFYLPNTPVSELPAKAQEALHLMYPQYQSSHTGAYMIYNVSEESTFLLAINAIPETAQPEKQDMDGWLGHFTGTGIDFTIEFDSSLNTYVFDGTFFDAISFEKAPILADANDPAHLIVYCTKDDIELIVSLDVGDGLVVVSIIYTEVDLIPVYSYFYPEKAH